MVTEAEDELVRAESHKIRWRIMLGTAIFAIPCVILTGNMLVTAEEQVAGATDYYDAAETARELAVVCPEFKNYSIGMEVSAQAQGGDGVERQNGTKQLVARVTTSEPLASQERTIAEELIRLDAPDVERVGFSVG